MIKITGPLLEKEALTMVKFSCNGGGGDAFPPSPEERPDWCTCGVCQPMPSAEENKC